MAVRRVGKATGGDFGRLAGGQVGDKRQSKAVKSGQAGELRPVCRLFEHQLSVIWGGFMPELRPVCAAARDDVGEGPGSGTFPGR